MIASSILDQQINRLLYNMPKKSWQTRDSSRKRKQIFQFSLPVRQKSYLMLTV